MTESVCLTQVGACIWLLHKGLVRHWHSEIIIATPWEFSQIPFSKFSANMLCHIHQNLHLRSLLYHVTFFLQCEGGRKRERMQLCERESTAYQNTIIRNMCFPITKTKPSQSSDSPPPCSLSPHSLFVWCVLCNINVGFVCLWVVLFAIIWYYNTTEFIAVTALNL